MRDSSARQSSSTKAAIIIIVVGRVLAFDRSDRLPLVFHSGQYNRQIADAIARALGMRTRHLLDWA